MPVCLYRPFTNPKKTFDFLITTIPFALPKAKFVFIYFSISTVKIEVYGLPEYHICSNLISFLNCLFINKFEMLYNFLSNFCDFNFFWALLCVEFFNFFIY